jgi:hypothetical protein
MTLVVAAAGGVFLGALLVSEKTSFLWKAMVEAPAQWLSELTFKRVVFALIAVVLIMIFSQAFTADLAVIFAFDALTWLDIMIAAWLFKSTSGKGLVMHRLKRWVSRRKAWLLSLPVISGVVGLLYRIGDHACLDGGRSTPSRTKEAIGVEPGAGSACPEGSQREISAGAYM